MESLRILLGERGVLYQIELTSKALAPCARCRSRDSRPAAAVERVVETARPVGFDGRERAELFAERHGCSQEEPP